MKILISIESCRETGDKIGCVTGCTAQGALNHKVKDSVYSRQLAT